MIFRKRPKSYLLHLFVGISYVSQNAPEGHISDHL